MNIKIAAFTVSEKSNYTTSSPEIRNEFGRLIRIENPILLHPYQPSVFLWGRPDYLSHNAPSDSGFSFLLTEYSIDNLIERKNTTQ